MRWRTAEAVNSIPCISSSHIFSFDFWPLQELSSIIQDLKRVEQQLLGIDLVLF